MTTVTGAVVVNPGAPLQGDYTPLSPAWWAQRLMPRIEQQTAYASYYDASYTGDRQMRIMQAEYDRLFSFAVNAGRHPSHSSLPAHYLDGSHPWHMAHTSEITPPKSALAAVGVDVMAERLHVLGFAEAITSTQPDATVDPAATGPNFVPAVTEGWRRNDLDVMEPIATVETLVKGRVLLLVWPGKDGKSVVTVEDPSQMAVARRSRPPYDVLAGLKVYTDEWTGDLEYLVWCTDGMHTLRTIDGRMQEDLNAFEPAHKALDGEIPIVEMSNRPRLLRPPSSALTLVTPYADADALLMGWMLIAARFGALPLITLSGQQLPRAKNPDGSVKLDHEGYPIVESPYDVRADSLLVAEDPKAQWAKLDSSNLAGFVATLQEVRVAVRGITKVPALYYGEGTSAGQSGETVRAAETPLIHGAQLQQRVLGQPWRRTAQFMHRIDTGSPIELVTAWADPKTYVQSQAVDAMQKYVASGVPLEVALEQTGLAPEVVRRAVEMANQQKIADGLLLNQPLTPPPLLPV
ncbi:MAG: hypothetical protein JWP11_1911 [Frankiales bacterium]|nr:hypothetical protein [Frankiales bacterium]